MRPPRKQYLNPEVRPSTNQLCSQTRHHDNFVSPLPYFSHRTSPSTPNTLTSSSSSSLPFSTLLSTALRIFAQVGDGHVEDSIPIVHFHILLFLKTCSSPCTSPQHTLHIATVPQHAHSPCFPPLSIPRTSHRTQSTTKTCLSLPSPSSLPVPFPLCIPTTLCPTSHQQSTIHPAKLLGKAAQQSFPSTPTFCTRSTRLPPHCQHKTSTIFVNPTVNLQPFPNITLNCTIPFPFLLAVPFCRRPLVSSSPSSPLLSSPSSFLLSSPSPSLVTTASPNLFISHTRNHRPHHTSSTTLSARAPFLKALAPPCLPFKGSSPSQPSMLNTTQSTYTLNLRLAEAQKEEESGKCSVS